MPDMPSLSSSLTLAAVPTAVKLSRAFAAVTLRSWGLGRMTEEAELVISEIATNAVKATGITDAEPGWSERADLAVIRVRIAWLQTRLLLEVWDSDQEPPKPEDAGPDAENGRGLTIIEALCARWDYALTAHGGKVVWAELAIPPLPVTDAGLAIRIPARPAPVRPAVNHDLPTLRRVYQGLKNLQGRP
jgi:anti-sigma regulatory factor (Ser/Thr protein kinase)